MFTLTAKDRLQPITLPRLFFFMVLGGFLGIVGSLIERPYIGIIYSVLLVGIVGASRAIFQQTRGTISGIVAGCILGTIVAVASWYIGGQITDIGGGILFGLTRGAVIGGAVGAITRAEPDEGDSWFVRITLYVGSVVVGSLLGIGVGLITGLLLGIIQVSRFGAFLAMLLGLVVGGYLSSYSKRPLLIAFGALACAALALLSERVGGAPAGVVLGAFSGASAPMLLVGTIGAYGGFAARGFVAMIREALEAPSEMLQQGAVPFLAPAILVGMIVGTAAVGIASLLALPVTLAIFGILLGAFGEMDGRPNNRITPRAIIDLVILGSDDWPTKRLLNHLRQHQRLALTGGVIGMVVGLISGLLGSMLGQLAINWLGSLL